MPVHGVEAEMKPSVPDNSLTALQCYEDDDLAERNPFDEFEFHDDNQPLNLIEEQHKDLSIRRLIEWIQQS